MKINLDKDKKYLLACSYGPDSMALFGLLLQGEYYFEVALVNYHMRPESEMERQQLESLCLQKGIKFHYIDVLPAQVKKNFQAWARTVRYDFFREIISKNGLDALLTGHHKDDVLETYLMQKSSKREVMFFGIKALNRLDKMIVMRPLLGYEKSQLIDYCHDSKISFAIDKSNLESKYTRNYFRNKILAKLSSDEKAAMISHIEELNKVEMCLNARLLQHLNERLEVKKTIFEQLKPHEKRRLVYLMFDKIGAAKFFSRGIFSQIEQTIASKKQTALFKLNGTIYFSLAYEKFSIIDISLFQPYEFIVEDKKNKFLSKHLSFDLTGDLKKYKINDDSFPLTIRTSRTGDFYQIKDYYKRVSRLFIDMKLPKHLRLIWPLIIDAKGKIIYIPRYRDGYDSNQNSKLHILW